MRKISRFPRYRLAMAITESTFGIEEQRNLKPNIFQRPLGIDVTSLRAAEVRTALTGIESAPDFKRASHVDAALGQGSLFGPPRSTCLPTHGGGGVAYNHSSSYGAFP